MHTILTLLLGIMTIIKSAEFNVERLDGLRDNLINQLGKDWVVKSETRLSVDGSYTNDRGRAVEKIVKPGMTKISAIGASDIAIGRKEENNITTITIRMFEFTTEEDAMKFFKDKYESDKDFNDDGTGMMLSSTSGKLVFRRRGVTFSISVVKIDGEYKDLGRQVADYLKLISE
jgi:hypothetical protein